jgi:hypothetical protein
MIKYAQCSYCMLPSIEKISEEAHEKFHIYLDQLYKDSAEFYRKYKINPLKHGING